MKKYQNKLNGRRQTSPPQKISYCTFYLYIILEDAKPVVTESSSVVAWGCVVGMGKKNGRTEGHKEFGALWICGVYACGCGVYICQNSPKCTLTLCAFECTCACFGSTHTKIGTIQRRLAWPLCEDDI